MIKTKYISYVWQDSGANSGPVIAFDRDAYPGEKSGTVSLNFLSQGLTPANYTVLKGNIKKRKLIDITKDEAYDTVISAIDVRNAQENLDDFTYQKSEIEDEHNYTADVDSISGVQNDCVARVLLESSSIDNAISVPNGKWKTADTDDDGSPIYVAFTMGEFMAFTIEFMQRSAKNFGVKQAHKDKVLALYNDNTSTAADILAYDFTTGWY